MRLRSLLQKLMILVAVSLLIACLVAGAPLETDERSLQSVLWILTLVVFIGAAAFHISEAVKPLDAVLVGSFLGTCMCLCEVLGISNGGFSADLLFSLFLTEFLLSAGYRIGRQLHIFDKK